MEPEELTIDHFSGPSRTPHPRLLKSLKEPTTPIESGENCTDVPVELPGSGLDPGEAVDVVLELQIGADAEVSESYRSFEIQAAKTAE